ncbi:MAG: hypothetical protein ACK5PP_01470 [Acidimicrobiales bacterium]
MTGWPRGRARDGGIDEIPIPGRQGRLWLCGKHAVGPDPEALLARVGADAIVCLCQPHEIDHRYPVYAAWLAAEADHRAVWFPTPDLSVRPLADTTTLVDDLVARLDRGRGLVVHCGAGIGRAGTMAVAILLAGGVPPDDALASVARHRPGAGPEAGSQTELVAELAGHYRPERSGGGINDR